MILPARRLIQSSVSKAFNATNFCESQTNQLDARLTLVDHDDNIIGSTTKLDGHLNDKLVIGHPHRAFSLFLFNTSNQLLFQQRSAKKITFPSMWTNTCCSHPDHVPAEMDTSLDWIGPRRAAQRRTEFEMGIHLDLLDLQCGARILYMAQADQTFTEYELDYIIFAKKQLSSFEVNPDEVKSFDFVSLKDLDDFVAEKKSNGEEITPWFKLIMESKLIPWWKRLE